MKHRAYQLYKERKFTQRQVAESLDCSLGTANKYIHSIDVEKEQSELTRLAAACKSKPFFCGPDHKVGQSINCFWGLIGEPRDIYGNKTYLL